MIADRRRAYRKSDVLERLHHVGLNFEPLPCGEDPADAGWTVDDHRVRLPAEQPGPPAPGGPFETAARLLRTYEFADPAIVRAAFAADGPLEGRTMLLEARFFGLRFLLGVRVCGVVDETVEADGRRARVWGWNYRTLEGHLEQGQMDYEVWKLLDTGEVLFRIYAYSRRAPIRNPLVRLGFAVFGRGVQRRFMRRSLARMRALVHAEAIDPRLEA